MINFRCVLGSKEIVITILSTLDVTRVMERVTPKDKQLPVGY